MSNMKIQKPLDSTGRLGVAEHGVIIDLRDPKKVCICHGPPMQPCGPKCRYPYTDEGARV